MKTEPAWAVALKARQAAHVAARPAIAKHALRSCLVRAAHVFFVGVSETLDLVEHLSAALNCSHRQGVEPTMRFKLCEFRPLRNRSYDFRAVAECKEDLYSRHPFVTQCTKGSSGLKATLHFYWKTKMFSPERDAKLRSRVLAAARHHHEPVILLLGGGVSHFTQFRDYRKGTSHLVADSFALPGLWRMSYINATRQLFDMFAPRAAAAAAMLAMPPNVCVLWKHMHITRRHNGTHPAAHHPSTEGGIHEELNRRSSELARPRCIEVVDPTELTRRLRPDGFRMSDARGRGGSEGDVYHGYPPFDLVTDVVQRMCDGCARQRPNMYLV